MRPTLDWLEDPEIFQVNRCRPHSDHKFYPDREGLGQDFSALFQNLNGTWKFAYAEEPSGRPENFYKEEVSCDAFDEIQVPGHIQLQGYDRCQYINTMYPWDGHEELRPPYISKTYAPVGCYVRYFELQEELKGRRIFLSFQGVETAFYVWMNGEFVGYSEDSFTPAEFEVTQYIKEGENKLAVEVYKRSSASWLEDQDFWRFSGIFRDVYLYAVPELHVRDLFVHAGLTNGYTRGRLELDIQLLEEASGNLEIFLEDDQGREVIASSLPLEKEMKVELDPGRVHPWSAEKPYLYTLKLCLKDSGGRAREWVRQDVGFRNFEMIDNVMCINGKRIVFHGVNRHEFHPKTGRSITRDDMLWDIRFLKQNNINAVRTSHYPDQSFWYELCDRYGIYLIDETNLESHGSWQKLGVCEPSWNVPGSLPQWRENVLDRARSMLERDKNHPSVLIWSCGNESYAGEDILAMSCFFHERDASRLVHYEGVFWNRDYDQISDMESRMYAKPEEIEAYLEQPGGKPYISCEYMHAMGNSCGGMELYTALEERYERYQGGFIWDYIDQALYQKDETGKPRLVYGGDFDERATDYCFCTNGIVYADRTPSPKVQEVKQLFSDIKIRIKGGRAVIENHSLFTDLEEYSFLMKVEQEGKVLSSKALQVQGKPGEKAVISLKDWIPRADKELVVTITALLKDHTPYGEKGREVSFGQEVLYDWRPEVLIPQKDEKDNFRITYGDVNVGVKGKNFSAMFSRGEGGLISLVYDGKEYITRTPGLTFYRALTDNDRGSDSGYRESGWLAASRGISYVKDSFRAEETEEGLKVSVEYEAKYPEVFRCVQEYEIHPTGTLKVRLSYPGIRREKYLPLFGIDFKLKKENNRFVYYGLGPEENYLDRKKGARLGVYESSPKKNMAAYLIPQECGNREEVRYVELRDAQGRGIRFEALERPFSCSVLPYSAWELENAMHIEELPKVRYTWLRLMAAQQGVGGDDSWGAPIHPQYLLEADKEWVLAFQIRPAGTFRGREKPCKVPETMRK